MRDLASIVLLLNISLFAALVEYRIQHSHQPLFSRVIVKTSSDTSSPSEPLQTLPTVTRDQLVEYLKNGDAIFVDARPQQSYIKGTIPSSINLPAGEDIPDHYDEQLKAARKVVVFCAGESCEDSTKLGNTLVMEGVQGVVVYEAGYSDWEDAGLPTVALTAPLKQR